MEEYVRVKSGALLDRFEWNGGLSITPKEHKAREKAIREGNALEVEEFSNSGSNDKVKRKIF